MNKEIMDQIKAVFDNLMEVDHEQMGKDSGYCDECDSDISECICEDQGEIEEDESYEELEENDPLKKGFQVIIVSSDVKDPFINEED